jgi:hypothetical protein
MVVIFYFPSRRGSGRCSAAMDISVLKEYFEASKYNVDDPKTSKRVKNVFFVSSQLPNDLILL